MRRSIYKRAAEIAAMLPAGELTCTALDAVEAAIRPGVTTLELDAVAERTIREGGGEPNFALVPGYRHTICASVGDAVVHGIPNDRPLRAGDVVSVDCGALLDGWNGDSARTLIVPGDVGDEPAGTAIARRMSEACRIAMWAGIASLARRRHLGEVGADIEAAINAEGDYGILEDYTGHGIGRSMHEEPTLFNIATRSRGPVIKPGLAVCVEPMITAGGSEVTIDDDGWTVRTADGSLAAHWEHTVLVHAGGVWASTAPDGGAAGLAPHGIVPTRPAG
ncbi:methionine aminopeptidase [Pseudoclavibacter endophyticus]|uniref:Methionine aminopeptidase n=1 Tax=Pseudoclavibacter endophyticus TaxID=1778590 RepID=A0A6H9WKB8_9MICO|nr:type I methionyl aminopeptidase [Pseudoclavibacter endophyticus]KAB1649306.1 type I methionyl aminopeptidase [Pseudoclavibacter endophyticus]GGA63624.1 methionine aminopeptidase [Pseudoclavibacter endophyticus]